MNDEIYTMEGQIVKVLEERSGISQHTGRAWKIASYLIQTLTPPFQRTMTFDVHDGEINRIQLFDLQLGKKVKIWFTIDAREYQNRWYNSISVVRVEPLAEQTEE